ncbi:unnamed protein product [Ectocarpus sp. CCAP 1310/34]|nr:unnamed protein product [Ectocarpus sp. CCAP 1310/34]
MQTAQHGAYNAKTKIEFEPAFVEQLAAHARHLANPAPTMTKRGRRVPTGGTSGRPPTAIKGANAAAARNAKAMNKLLDDMEKREAATAAAEAALAAKEEEVKAVKASVDKDREKLARDIARSDVL